MTPADLEPRDTKSHREALVRDLLGGMDTPVTIDVLADQVATHQPSRPGGDSLETWADIHKQLYMVDLPALRQKGQVEFDASTGLVSLPDGETAELTEPSDGNGCSVYSRLVGLAVLSPLLVGLTSVEAWPFARAPTLFLAVAVVVLVATLALFRTVRTP